MTDFLDSARRDIESRLSELRGEVGRLEDALKALGGGRRGATRRGRPASGGAPKRRRSANGRRRSRRAGGGTRSTQAHRLVRENPGITIADLAKKMSITPNYLYRVMPQLEQEGKVRKQDKGWHAAGG